MSKRPSASTSTRLRRTRLPATSAARWRGLVEHAREHAEPDREAQQADPAQGGGAVVVEQVVGGVDGLVEADRGHRVAEPDERGLHGDLLDEQREPAGGPQQPAYLPVLRGEVDGLAARGPDPAQEQLDGRALERRAVRRAPGAGRPGRRTRRGWSAVVSAVTTTRASVVPSSMVWSTGPASVASRSSPSSTSRQSRPSTARPRAPASESPGAVSESRLSQRRDEDVVERAQVARVDPRRLRLGRDVAHDQRLAAAGRSHDGDPPRLVERLAQRALDVVTTQARRQHGTNLSLMRRRVGE